MCPEEWLVGTHLVPAHKQLWLWIFEETAHIRWGRGGRKEVGKQGEKRAATYELPQAPPSTLSSLFVPGSCALYLAPLPPNQDAQFLPLSPPQKESPTSPKLRHIGIEIFKWSHSAVLSPVHTAPKEDERDGACQQ